MRIFKHIVIIGAGLTLFLGLPALAYGIPAALSGGGADAVSGATLEVPAQPGGEYLLILNESRHEDTLSEWEAFFYDRPQDVIMEDLDCRVIAGDAGGLEMAEHFRARLAENQMKLKAENGLLLASRLKEGRFDAAILSLEAAESYAVGEDSVCEAARIFTIAGEGK